MNLGRRLGDLSLCLVFSGELLELQCNQRQSIHFVNFILNTVLNFDQMFYDIKERTGSRKVYT